MRCLGTMSKKLHTGIEDSVQRHVYLKTDKYLSPNPHPYLDTGRDNVSMKGIKS